MTPLRRGYHLVGVLVKLVPQRVVFNRHENVARGLLASSLVNNHALDAVIRVDADPASPLDLV